MKMYSFQKMKLVQFDIFATSSLKFSCSRFLSRNSFSKVVQIWPKNERKLLTAPQCISIHTRYNSFFSIYSIIEEAITYLGSNRPTAYSASTKLGGRVDSLESFLKQLSIMLNFQLLGTTIRPFSLAFLVFPTFISNGCWVIKSAVFSLISLRCVMAEMGSGLSNQPLFHLYLSYLRCVQHFKDSINQIKNSTFSILNHRYFGNYPLTLSLSWSTTLHISHNQTYSNITLTLT